MGDRVGPGRTHDNGDGRLDSLRHAQANEGQRVLSQKITCIKYRAWVNIAGDGKGVGADGFTAEA